MTAYDFVVLGAVLPLGLGLVLASLRVQDPRWLATSAAVAAVAARWFAVGPPVVPPVEAADWAVPVAVAAGLLAWVPASSRLATVVKFALVSGAAYFIVQPRAEHGWPADEVPQRLALLLAVIVASWNLLLVAAREVPARGLLAATSTIATASAVAIGATGSLTLGRGAGIFAAALGGVAIASLRAGPGVRGEAVVDVVLWPLWVWVGAAVLYSELPLWAGVALPMSVVTAFAAARDGSGFPWRGLLVGGLVAGGIAGAIVREEWVEASAAPSGQPY